jgi:hypothetical protein
LFYAYVAYGTIDLWVPSAKIAVTLRSAFQGADAHFPMVGKDRHSRTRTVLTYASDLVDQAITVYAP